jgi:hypothetical protein
MHDDYRSSDLLGSAETGVLVVHCSDPRYQPHFQEFLRQGLGVEHYALIAVPGGAQFLTLMDYLPKFAWAGWRWLKFMADVVAVQRIILIAHDDCRWYQDMRFGLHSTNLGERQAADLGRVRAACQERFKNARVDLYYARLEGQRVVFASL